MTSPDDTETLVPCPACEACITCNGTGKVTCYECPMMHSIDCPADTTCCICQGTQLVSHPRRVAWLRVNPPKGLAP